MIILDKFINIIGLALILMACVMAIASAQSLPEPKTQWLITEHSIAAAQSTASLVQGRTARAITMAERSLISAKGHDRVVGLHNLCIGLLRQGDAERAPQVCDTAIEVAVITKPEIADIVISNIAHERSRTPRPNTLARATN